MSLRRAVLGAEVYTQSNSLCLLQKLKETLVLGTQLRGDVNILGCTTGVYQPISVAACGGLVTVICSI